jgi:methylglyoxal synthase
MYKQRHIALVAHDSKKADLLAWAEFNEGTLRKHVLYSTGTTGLMLQRELGLLVTCFLSGPVGAISKSARRSPRAPSIC